MTRYEIIATFPTGKTAKVETHKSMKRAQLAIDAMDAHNRNDLACGYGFPQGVPTYSINKVRI